MRARARSLGRSFDSLGSLSFDSLGSYLGIDINDSPPSTPKLPTRGLSERRFNKRADARMTRVLAALTLLLVGAGAALGCRAVHKRSDRAKRRATRRCDALRDAASIWAQDAGATAYGLGLVLSAAQRSRLPFLVADAATWRLVSDGLRAFEARASQGALRAWAVTWAPTVMYADRSAFERHVSTAAGFQVGITDAQVGMTDATDRGPAADRTSYNPAWLCWKAEKASDEPRRSVFGLDDAEGLQLFPKAHSRVFEARKMAASPSNGALAFTVPYCGPAGCASTNASVLGLWRFFVDETSAGSLFPEHVTLTASGSPIKPARGDYLRIVEADLPLLDAGLMCHYGVLRRRPGEALVLMASCASIAVVLAFAARAFASSPKRVPRSPSIDEALTLVALLDDGGDGGFCGGFGGFGGFNTSDDGNEDFTYDDASPRGAFRRAGAAWAEAACAEGAPPAPDGRESDGRASGNLDATSGLRRLPREAALADLVVPAEFCKVHAFLRDPRSRTMEFDSTLIDIETGKNIPYQVCVSPVSSEAPERICVFRGLLPRLRREEASSQSAAALKKAEDRLEEELRTERYMSHELKNRLIVLADLCAVASAPNEPLPEKVRNKLEMLNSLAVEVLETTMRKSALLLLATGVYEPQDADAIDVAALVSKRLARLRLAGRRVDVLPLPQSAHHKLRLDPLLVTIILDNVVSNALKYGDGSKAPTVDLQVNPVQTGSVSLTLIVRNSAGPCHQTLLALGDDKLNFIAATEGCRAHGAHNAATFLFGVFLGKTWQSGGLAQRDRAHIGSVESHTSTSPCGGAFRGMSRKRRISRAQPTILLKASHFR
ncbi:hypothetical protein M885DRAFT_188372 [Pelagophyceae sp. CCMP2097]|nr:hypothetical protein M885DRAFT_188372 [Pelagophyceae sp. CCMP2097]